MARESTTETAEYQRLASLAISPKDKALKTSLFATFVDDFAARLLPDVKSALESEASSEIAKEWIREATSALKTLAPELPADLEQQAAFQRAVKWTQEELTAEFCNDVLKPSDEEIRRESIELAQCILANWFSVLEHAKEDAATAFFALNANGIPVTQTLDELLAGVEAFAVSRDKLAPLFDEFLTSHVVVGGTRALAPQLFLARKTEREFYLANTEDAARNLVRVPAPDDRQNRFDNIFDFFNGLITAMPTAVGAGNAVGAAAGDATLSTDAENHLARAAAWLAQTVDAGEPSSAADFQKVLLCRLESADLATAPAQLDLTSNKLSQELGTIVLYDLDDALGSGLLTRCITWPRRYMIESSLKTAAVTAVDEQTMTSLRRVATVAAGYTLACKMTSDKFDESNDLEGVVHLLDNCPTAQTVLCFSASAAHKAASMPKAAAVCTRISRHSAFTDL